MKKQPMLILCACVALLAAGCKSSDEQVVTKTPVESIQLKDTSCVVEYFYPATLKGIEDVEIYPQVTGRITAVKVSEGQYVQKDQILFEIDDVPYRAAYDVAKANVSVAESKVATAQLTLESKQRLFDEEVISDYQLKLAKNDLLTAKASLESARASLKNAENELSFTKVRTMTTGYVGTLPYKIGSVVSQNIQTPLTTVSNNSSVYADFSISESQYLELYSYLTTSKKTVAEEVDGNKLSLTTADGTRYAHKGHVHSFSGLISSTTGALPVRALFPNPERLLLSGGSSKVVFSVHQDNVILIPRSSIKEIQNKMYVFVINNGILNQIEVNASRYDNKYWMLHPSADGTYPLKSGDLITATTNRLQNDMPVEITNK